MLNNAHADLLKLNQVFENFCRIVNIFKLNTERKLLILGGHDLLSKTGKENIIPMHAVSRKITVFATINSKMIYVKITIDNIGNSNK